MSSTIETSVSKFAAQQLIDCTKNIEFSNDDDFKHLDYPLKQKYIGLSWRPKMPPYVLRFSNGRFALLCSITKIANPLSWGKGNRAGKDARTTKCNVIILKCSAWLNSFR